MLINKIIKFITKKCAIIYVYVYIDLLRAITF